MINLQHYTKWIPPFYRNKPVYTQILSIFLQNYVDMINTFDKITPAINKNSNNLFVLNMLGDIYNVSRFVDQPIYNSAFSWNINGLGWNQGSWLKQQNIDTIVDDVMYEWLVLFRMNLITWNGSSDDLVRVLEDSFPVADFMIVDDCNGEFTVWATFHEDNFALKQLLLNGGLQLNITGIKIKWEEL